MYRRFGSKVTIVQRGDRLIPRDDEDVSAAVKEILEAEGVDVRLNAECLSFEPQADKLSVKLNCASGSDEVLGSHLLLAVSTRS